ncbi:hypothetical protein IQ266_07810 [filamentous cyanobacterium LEGE 11480]|uniref:non-specific serine/threonine protein kinase n=1 Tax=Romeriopsis navalis LEGE 11480 TaxID=2777977 RepID=A0A928VKX9_9CYAN|nr:COR domain-containing protein [Romeriopsis navalis]MBE9029633.1 hypothetical protein [Romeriopsis navalis LEGE 11480]
MTQDAAYQQTQAKIAEALKTGATTLYLRYNQLTQIPAEIAQLTNLSKLYLISNQLTQIPAEIAQLTNLSKLYLSSNQLTQIPAEIAQLTNLSKLDLDKNPLNSNLANAYASGLDAVFDYLKAQAESSICLNEAKLILVGEGEVGKTCLLGALRSDPWVAGRPTTHGIEIKPVTVIAPDGPTEITLNGWDFGGQQVYRPTHQLFFSAPAVYLVVWKPREGPQQGFVKEWITLIKHREPDAKILIVATHGGPGQRQPDIDRQELIDQFGSDTILGFHHIDSKPDNATQQLTGITELRKAIAKVAFDLPEMGETVPAKWEEARALLRQTEAPYLPYSEVLDICTKLDIPTAQAELFIHISHRLGHLTHYSQDPILKDIVILKPDWLAKAISFVLDDATTRNNSGLADFDHLSQLWSHPPFEGEDGYPEDLHPIFLALMERFDLSYKVSFDNPKENAKNTSLIAQLVPDNRPETLATAWPATPEPGDRQQIQICRIVDEKRQSATAEGLFYQLIVRLHKYSLGRHNYNHSIHWQRGIVLDNDYNGRALLEHIGNDIRITVRAAYPERFLSYLTQEIKYLVESFWEGLRCNVMVPCISPCGLDEPGKGLYEAAKLIDSKKKNRPDYPCERCGEWQNIDKLLSNAPLTQPDTQTQKLEALQQEIKAVGQLVTTAHQELSQGQEALLSQSDEQFSTYMQMLTDEAKDGPRLFSLKPVKTKFLDTNPNWVTAKFEITLWCEHSLAPLPTLNPDNPTLGVYTIELTREWISAISPWLKPIATVLSAVAPAAIAATKLNLSDAAYKGIDEQIGMTQQTLTLASKGVTDTLAVKSDRQFDRGDSIRAQGAVLRKLHTQIKTKDPSFGGLERVQNRRSEFLWVHKQFVSEY